VRNADIMRYSKKNIIFTYYSNVIDKKALEETIKIIKNKKIIKNFVL
jgi:hypothetical protein